MKASAAVYGERVSTLLWVVVSLSLCACLKPESTPCPSGLTCPVGMMCAVSQDICIKDSPSCGDGVVQASVGEACDDGNIVDGDGCSLDCKSDEACGNNRLDKDEVCDDGNTVGGDNCSADCRSNEQCGNGIVDLEVDEVCDDGNKRDGDKCSADCYSDERCGNDVVDKAAQEVCDDGNTKGGDGCSSDCRSGEGCGNGTQDQGEQCDDGNTNNQDSCLNLSGKCLVARCGDGFVQDAVEECDDGGVSATCDHDCTKQVCGDGIVNLLAEQCDPGAPGRFTETCNSDCTISWCGDGILNEAAGEQCDKGRDNGNGGCSRSCKQAICGNGIKEDGEACDDGNTLACGQCSANCREDQTAANAIGRITAASGSDVHDGELFSLSDGGNLPVIFEFEKRNGISNGHIPVYINSNFSDVQVAEAIATAIRNSPWQLNIQVTHPSNAAYVDLVHSQAGAYGNQRIVTTVGAEGFKVTGMSGGRGNDCVAGTKCKNDNDCTTELECDMGVCR